MKDYIGLERTNESKTETATQLVELWYEEGKSGRESKWASKREKKIEGEKVGERGWEKKISERDRK